MLTALPRGVPGTGAMDSMAQFVMAPLPFVETMKMKLGEFRFVFDSPKPSLIVKDVIVDDMSE